MLLNDRAGDRWIVQPIIIKYLNQWLDSASQTYVIGQWQHNGIPVVPGLHC